MTTGKKHNLYMYFYIYLFSVEGELLYSIILVSAIHQHELAQLILSALWLEV